MRSGGTGHWGWGSNTGVLVHAHCAAESGDGDREGKRRCPVREGAECFVPPRVEIRAGLRRKRILMLRDRFQWKSWDCIFELRKQTQRTHCPLRSLSSPWQPSPVGSCIHHLIPGQVGCLKQSEQLRQKIGIFSNEFYVTYCRVFLIERCT